MASENKPVSFEPASPVPVSLALVVFAAVSEALESVLVLVTGGSVVVEGVGDGEVEVGAAAAAPEELLEGVFT